MENKHRVVSRLFLFPKTSIMKKHYYAWLVIVLCAMTVTGCGSGLSDKEKKIVGKWYFAIPAETDTDYDDDTFIKEFTWSGEGEVEYFDDHTEKCQINAIYSIHVVDEDYEEWIELKYKYEGEQAWSMEGDELIEKGKSAKIKFIGFSTMQEYNPDVDDYYINTLKSIINDGMPELKQEMLKKSASTIVELTDDEMILEDEDGEKETYTKI